MLGGIVPAISQGTGATSSAARAYSIFVHGLDVAMQPGQTGGNAYGTDIDSLVITERLGEADRAEFTIDDPSEVLSIERDQDVLIVDHAGRSLASGARVADDIFRGLVDSVSRTPLSSGIGWEWHVVAISLEALLDRRVLTSGVIPTTISVVSALQQVLSTLDPRVSAVQVDVNAAQVTRTGPSAGILIGTAGAPGVMLAPVSLAGKTYRQAIQDVVAASDGPAYIASGAATDLFASLQFDVDMQGRFRYGITAGINLGYLPLGLIADGNNIREGTGAPLTQAAPSDIQVTPDLSGYVSRVFVQGVDATSSGWVINDVAEKAWGRVDDYITAPSATSATTRDAAGYAYLQLKRPIIRVQLTLSDTHDRLIPNPTAADQNTGWHVRSYSQIRSDSGYWADPSATSGVTGLCWEVIKRFSGGGKHMSLELGFGGGRQSGGASIATAFADLSAETKAAGRLVGTLDEVALRTKAGIPTDADFDVPRDGFIVLDTGSPVVVWQRAGGVWKPVASAELQATFTAPVNITNTVEASADTIVTASAITCDGISDILVTFYAPYVRPDTTLAARLVQMWLFEDGSSIGRIGLLRTPAAGSDEKGFTAMRRLTPTAGSHTYSVRATVNVATGAVGAGVGGAGNDVPGYISIKRIA